MDKIRVEKKAIRRIEEVIQAVQGDLSQQFDAMNQLHDTLVLDPTFESEALKGFLEVMEIALEYQNKIMPLVGDYLSVYAKYYDELSKLDQKGIYQNIL